MTEILAAVAGEYQAVTGMYASYDGEWVEVPLGPPAPPAWKRPIDWLATSVTVGEQKAQVLAHVGSDVSIETNRQMTVMASPDYTVDWGDGSAVENIASGVVATHLYNPTSLAGTATSTGMLQALVTVTPQAAGVFQTFAISNPYYTGKTYRSPAVEIVFSAPGANMFNFGVQSCKELTRIEFKSPTVIFSTVSLFSGCTSLREIIGEIRSNASGSVMNGMFNGCTVLAKFPTMLFNGQHDDVSNAFFGCAAMVTVPPFLSSWVTGWTSAFQGCTSLKEVPASLDTSKGTTFTSMFNGCTSLTKVGAIDTSKGVTFTSMFQGCTYLVDVPLLDTGNGVTFTSMFQTCTRLVSVPTFNLVKGTALSNMFLTCTSLAQVPPFNIAGANANVQSMFTGCNSLTTVALNNPQTLTNMNSMFSSCANLIEITGVNLAGPVSSTGITSFTSGCNKLLKLGLAPGKGPRFSCSSVLQTNMMDAAALNDFYTQCPTVSGQTLYVTQCPGGPTSTTSIATAKGWTVTVT